MQGQQDSVGPSDKRETPKKENASAQVAVAQCDDNDDRDVVFLPTAIVSVLFDLCSSLTCIIFCFASVKSDLFTDYVTVLLNLY